MVEDLLQRLGKLVKEGRGKQAIGEALVDVPVVLLEYAKQMPVKAANLDQAERIFEVHFLLDLGC